MFDERAYFLNVERTFGNKYGVCTPSDTRVPCNPTRITSHDLDDEHSVVTLRGRMQSIDGLSSNRDRGVKTEGVVSGSEVVVDRLWYAYDGKSNRGELGRHAQRVLSPDDNKTFHAQTIYGVENPAFTRVVSVGIGSA